MAYGLLILTILGIMGGVIAYVGDKLGTKIGKRKVTLFGLRPKYTSILVTIVTGMLIAATTLGVMSILSENVRIALFGMQKLQAQMASLTSEIDQKNKRLAEGEKLLNERTKELDKLSEDVTTRTEELRNVQYAYDSLNGELISLQDAHSEAMAKLASAEGEIKDLEATKAKLNESVSSLQLLAKKLAEGITHIREGEVLFRVGEVLSAAVVKPNLTEEESAVVLTNFINDTNHLILRRLNSPEEKKQMLYVSRKNLEDMAKAVAASKEQVLIRLVASGNIIYGEPTIAELEIHPYSLIYKKNDLVWSSVATGGQNAEGVLVAFLKEVNKAAQEKGILPNPITNEVGQISNVDLGDVIEALRNHPNPVRLEAVALEPAYTDGPIKIHVRIREI